ncbi:MAG: hypothetical protein LBQ34_06690 [Alphaproteobacteria bacterium]|jgi:hypothetical protein|nr:hypothetical protein [Alphaproteobacteria bacterium]
MFEISAKVDAKSKERLKTYFRTHSKKFGCRVGIQSSYPDRRLAAKDKILVGTAGKGYGQTRKTLSKKQGMDSTTNFEVARNIVFGYGQPARNFFKTASNPEFWQNQNFKFLVNFYKEQPDFPNVEKSLNNLGVTVLRRAITNGKYAPLKEETMKHKATRKVLIETGQMLRGIKAWNFNFSSNN